MSTPLSSTPTLATEQMPAPRSVVAAYWFFTVLFCLEMSFTAYYELRILPAAVQEFTRLGFPSDNFRIELSWAKIVGVLVLLIPIIPARLKEWAYAGFAIILASAIVAHLSIGDRPQAYIFTSLTSVLWALSYYFWRRLQSQGSRRFN